METDSQPAIVDDTAAQVWREILETDADADGDSNGDNNSSEEILVVGLSVDVLDGLISALRERTTDESTTTAATAVGTSRPRVMVLATKPVLNALRNDFSAASHAAELVEADTLSLRTSTERLDASLVITDNDVYSVVAAENLVAVTNTGDDGFVGATWEKYRRLWETGEPFDLRTPALSRVQTTLEAEFGPEMWATFDELRRAFDDRDANQSPKEGRSRTRARFVEVDLALLAAATHEKLLYDLGTWSEDVGLASRATFSRKKKHLEDVDVLDTEKVPVEIGRPRQRLLLGERVRGMDANELMATVAERLATHE